MLEVVKVGVLQLVLVVAAAHALKAVVQNVWDVLTHAMAVQHNVLVVANNVKVVPVVAVHAAILVIKHVVVNV